MKHLIMTEDTKLRATNLTIRRGGNCPNALEVLQQLTTETDAIKAYLVTSLPSKVSPATDRIIDSFGKDTPVNFQHCIHSENHTEPASAYVLQSQQTGSRTLVNYNDLPEMTFEAFERVARSFDTVQETWWHFEGRIPDTTLRCIRLLRELHPQTTISVEVERPGRPGLPELANEADVVFYSRTWAEDQGFASAEACLRGQQLSRASLAVCTWGAEGAVALSRPGGECLRCPVADGNKDITVIDSVGAGDTLIAGMLYGLLCHARDWDTKAKLKFAVDLASLKVQHEGFDGLGVSVTNARETS